MAVTEPCTIITNKSVDELISINLKLINIMRTFICFRNHNAQLHILCDSCINLYLYLIMRRFLFTFLFLVLFWFFFYYTLFIFFLQHDAIFHREYRIRLQIYQ